MNGLLGGVNTEKRAGEVRGLVRSWVSDAPLFMTDFGERSLLRLHVHNEKPPPIILHVVHTLLIV